MAQDPFAQYVVQETADDPFAQYVAQEDVQPRESGIPGAATMATGAALGGAKLAPGIVSLVNKSTRFAGPAAGLFGAYDASKRAMRGDMVGAAGSAVASATGAATLLPRVAEAVKGWTAPATEAVPKGSMHALTKATTAGKAPGILARGAGALSKAAGAAGVPLTALATVIDLQNYALESTKDPNMAERERRAILGMLGGGGLPIDLTK